MPTQADMESELDNAKGPEWSVCGQITHLPNGEGAALRRMYLTRSYQADGIVEKLLRGARIDLDPKDDAAFASWCLLAHTAAVISGTIKRFAYSEKRSLGKSLHLIGLQEMSVLRLVSARGPAIADQVRRTARIMARGKTDAIPTNLGTLRELADPNVMIAENARRRIARDFYAASDVDGRKTKGDAK